MLTSKLDFWALGVFAVGLLFHVQRRRFPARVGTSVFVGAVSLGIGIGTYEHHGPVPWNLYIACHITSALCLLWAVLGWVSVRLEHGETQSTDRATSGTFFTWALVTGLGSIVLTLHELISVTWLRVLSPGAPVEARPSTMVFWDISGLLAAILVWRGAGFRAAQPAMLLIGCAVLAWWTGLMVPSAAEWQHDRSAELWGLRPAWWTWSFQMQFAIGCVVISAAFIQDVRYRARRRRAWPNHLEDLVAPYSRWPAFIRLEAVLAAVVLVLGVYQIVGQGWPEWETTAASGLISAAAGSACLFMAYRRWSANTAGLGLALLSLAAVLESCAIAAFQGGRTGDYGARIPIVFNVVLFALAVMIMWWRWLAEVWRQQLLDGVAWTTAGRLIPYAKRTAFILTALGMLVAFEMALWPGLAPSSGDDNGSGRVVSGLAGIGLLGFLSGRRAARERSTSAASMAAALVVAALAFAFIRMPTSALRGWLIQYQAVVLSALALPILTLAEFLAKTRWHSFSAPMWLFALLALPGASLAALLSVTAQPAEWVRPLTLAILGAVYSFAASREHRRAFLVLGVVLLLAALSSLYHSYGAVIMP